MGVAGMFIGNVHEDVRHLCLFRIENEIDLQNRRMPHGRDRLRSCRSPLEAKAEPLVEDARSRQVVHPDTDVRQTLDPIADS